MSDTTLKFMVRGGMIVVGVAALTLVTLVTRKRGNVERTAPPTAVSGRRGPLLAIGVLGGLVALVGQWLGGGSVSENPSPMRMTMSLLGLAVAIGGFYAYSWLLKTGQD